MKKTLPLLRPLAACLAVLAACGALAQTPIAPPTPPIPPAAPAAPGAPPAPPARPAPPMRHEMLVLAGSQLDRERVVAGAPYCADAVHESAQSLADGNRIVQRQNSRQCRDSQGRTRQEMGGARKHVFLRDPVANESWMLDPDAKQAVRLDGARMAAPPHDPGMVDRLKELGREIRERVRIVRPADGAAAAPGADGPEQRRQIVIREMRPGDGPQPGPGAGSGAAPGAMPMPRPGPQPGAFAGAMPGPFPGEMPHIAMHTRLLGPRGAGTTNLLPAETIEGLKSDGSRTTWTIEAGRIGNEKPIQIVNEVWKSAELGITVRSRDVDPVVGENSFRLQNVVRGEPDAQLFKVPADYRKVEPRAMVMPPVPPAPPQRP